MSSDDPNTYLQPAATAVRDPVSGRSVWLAKMIQGARIDGQGVLHFDLLCTEEHAETTQRALVDAIVANLRQHGWGGAVQPRVGVKQAGARPRDPVPGMSGGAIGPHGGPVEKKSLEGVGCIIAVASGKGGVGKSTVACNLAVGLQKLGYAVGLLDADIYGPSIPTMLSVASKPIADPSGRVIPPRAYGVRCMSMGMMAKPNQAVIWRGPMVMDAVRTFLQRTVWGPIDVLVVDLPPGTGDAQLTLIQAVDLAGAIVVTTPQKVALDDAVRGLDMFRRLDVPLIGVVENMAYYQLPDGTKDHVFGQDGGKVVAKQFGTDVLAEVPLRTAIRTAGDEGLPAVLSSGPDGEVFRALAQAVAVKLGLAT